MPWRRMPTLEANLNIRKVFILLIYYYYKDLYYPYDYHHQHTEL